VRVQYVCVAYNRLTVNPSAVILLPMRKNLGFTLIELLVAITLISLLAGFAIANYSASQRNGRNAKRRADMIALQQAYEQYFIANSTYATPCSTMIVGYIQGTFPTDPKPSQSYYQICSATTYCMCALLEDGGGNSSTSNCTGFGLGDTYFCVQNQQ